MVLTTQQTTEMCLPYPLLSTTGVQGSDSAENRRGAAVAAHQVRRQFSVVLQKLIPMVLVTVGIPQLQYFSWWSMSLLAGCADSSLLSV